MICICVQFTLGDLKALHGVSLRAFPRQYRLQRGYTRPSAQFDSMNMRHLQAACKYHSGFTICK
jgi:hypothetical protein